MIIKSLTSFRFVAAFMVYLTHSISVFRDYQFGYVGVSFFFVLSGFILVYNYHSKFAELNKDTIKKFYIARLAKIYPVHLLTLFLSIPYMLITYLYFSRAMPTGLDVVSSFAANILMLHSFIPLPFGTMPYSFNLVSWSLSDELFFYLIFPFIVYILLKFKVNNSALRNLFTAILFFAAIIGVTALSSLFREVKAEDWFLYVFPFFRSLDFIMGILIGLIFVTKNKPNFVKNKLLFNCLELFSLVLLVVWIVLSPYVSLAFRFSVYYVPIWCLLIFIFAFQRGLISKILSNRWLVFLGEISFSFYMIHLLVINYVGLLHLGSIPHHVVTFTGSILLSSVIYVIYEEPIRKKIRFGIKKKGLLPQFSTTNQS